MLFPCKFCQDHTPSSSPHSLCPSPLSRKTYTSHLTIHLQSPSLTSTRPPHPLPLFLINTTSLGTRPQLFLKTSEPRILSLLLKTVIKSQTHQDFAYSSPRRVSLTLLLQQQQPSLSNLDKQTRALCLVTEQDFANSYDQRESRQPLKRV